MIQMLHKAYECVTVQRVYSSKKVQVHQTGVLHLQVLHVENANQQTTRPNIVWKIVWVSGNDIALSSKVAVH